MNNQKNNQIDPANKTLVPALRFPEFRGMEEWKLIELGCCLDYLQPTKYLVNNTDYDDKHKTPVLTAGKTFILGYTNEVKGIFEEKLPVIIFDDFTTASKYVDFPFKAKSSAMKILTAKNNFNIKFIYETMQMIRYEVGVHERHWISIFSKLEISTSDPKEQQKIADCLTSIDETITAQTKKLKTLKAHKKGLMQKLFPTENQTTPKLRFLEFQGNGGWEGKQLKSIISYFKGFVFQSKNYKSFGRRIIRVSDMGFDYIRKENNAIYINEKEAILYEKWKLQENDLIITTVGSKPPAYDSLVGRTIVVRSSDENSLLNQNAVCLRSKKDVDQKFLNNLFKRDEYIFFIESIIRGNANQGSIALKNLFEYQALLPQLKEQQKIADCLASMDQLITAQTQKIELLKQHKKGLMQQLFPSL